MGEGALMIEEEDALPGATLMRVHQDVRSRTGYEDAFEWSFAAHVREGRVVLIEFWIDRARARAAFGLES
jgi:ketosteroid isomerase-like protein